jgi:hypothetical protein
MKHYKLTGHCTWFHGAAILLLAFCSACGETANTLQTNPNGRTVADRQPSGAASDSAPADQTPDDKPKMDRAKAGPPKLDREIVDKHKQLYDMSCIPMTVEMVLKLTGHAPAEYFELQNAWKNKRDGNFSNFDGSTLFGLTFHKRFGMPRDEDFPLQRLFATIASELDAGRFVIVSLESNSGWHMYVIYGMDAEGDFLAVTKSGSQATGSETEYVRHVKGIISGMLGTDILTYEVTGPAPGHG